MVLFALLVKIGHLGRELFLSALLQLAIAVEILRGKKSLQLQEQITVNRRQFRAVGRGGGVPFFKPSRGVFSKACVMVLPT